MINTIILLNELQLFGAEFFDKKDFFELLIKALFNFLVIGYIVRYLYYPATKNKDYLFTYLLISLTVFLLCFLLENVKLQLGFALGLFAVFGIIRYRTDPIPIKEMTYLFIVITIGVINALGNGESSQLVLIFTNITLLVITYFLEKYWQTHLLISRNIIYEKIENIKPENHENLLSDLEERTGIKIVSFEIRRTDFLKDVANIRIYFKE